MISMTANAPLLHFSTSHVPEADRIGIWREVYGQMILRLDVEPLSERPFEADVHLRALPGLALVSGSISGARDRRTTALLSDGIDDLGLAVHWGGCNIVSQRGRETKLGEGEAVILSCGDSATVIRALPCRYLGVRIPRTALLALAPHAEDRIGMPIVRANPVLELLKGYVAVLLADANATYELGRLASDHVYELVALLLRGDTMDNPTVADRGGVRAARLRAIKADILKHLGNRELTINALASRHSVTPRYIQRLFENDGHSYTEFVLEQRLAHAHRFLCDPCYANRSVSTIAFEAGFGDLSYFNRAFRRRYGMTPSDVRRQARSRQ